MECVYCNYKCNIKSNYVRHMKTKKHIINMINYEKIKKKREITKIYNEKKKQMEEKLEKMEMYRKERETFYKYFNIPMNRFWYLCSHLNYKEISNYEYKIKKKEKKIIEKIVEISKINNFDFIKEPCEYNKNTENYFVYKPRIKDNIEITTFSISIKKKEIDIKSSLVGTSKKSGIKQNINLTYTIFKDATTSNDIIKLILKIKRKEKNMLDLKNIFKYVDDKWCNGRYSEFKQNKLYSYLYEYKELFIIYLFSLIEAMTSIDLADSIFQYIDFTYSKGYYYHHNDSIECNELITGKKRIELNFNSMYSNINWNLKDPIENLKINFILDD